MLSIEFYADINEGKIDIPLQYQDEFKTNVKVILLKTGYSNANSKEKIAKGFGALSHGANPDLWSQEKKAWERAVVDKYGAN